MGGKDTRLLGLLRKRLQVWLNLIFVIREVLRPLERGRLKYCMICSTYVLINTAFHPRFLPLIKRTPSGTTFHAPKGPNMDMPMSHSQAIIYTSRARLLPRPTSRMMRNPFQIQTNGSGRNDITGVL
jgi:hypothetical protein